LVICSPAPQQENAVGIYHGKSAGVEGLDKAQLCHTQRGPKKMLLEFQPQMGTTPEWMVYHGKSYG